jgi:hypothetical protein
VDHHVSGGADRVADKANRGSHSINLVHRPERL